jgi:hypothetical protein
MNESFTSGAGGLPGNDDLGATSAWYVWAAMGIYPPTPGADTLALHGPLFPSIQIARPNGNIQINGSGAGPGAQYVQDFSLNGSATSRSYIRYADIASGGTLSFTMGSSPNSTWGTDAADVPPSFTDGATQPPPAPALGTNLALGKPVTASASCGPAEAASNAVDGKLTGNSKWCSLATGTKTLTVDLGSATNVSSFVVKHAGLGGEHTGWNTGGFTIQTSTDGTTFTTAATVSGNRSSRTYHPLASARSARYVRLNVTAPSNTSGPGSDAARIYEFEVYGGGGSVPTNLALNRPATGSASCNGDEGPAKAVNGSVSGGNSDKWCSLAPTKFLQVDLGSTRSITSFIVRHAGAGGESTAYNTRDFDLQVSTDGTNWTTVVQARGNTADVSTHVSAVTGRYVRLNVLAAEQGSGGAARVYELEAYA